MEKISESIFKVLLVVMVAGSLTLADEMGTNFFLKASKSVPRIGRRGDVDFLKASKSVPRIGRRGGLDLSTEPKTYQRYFLSEKDVGESGDPWGYESMQGDEPYSGAGGDYQYDFQNAYARPSLQNRVLRY